MEILLVPPANLKRWLFSSDWGQPVSFGATEEFWSMSPEKRLVELSRKSASGENVSWILRSWNISPFH